MKTLDALKKAVEALKGPMEFRPRQVIISEEVLNIIAADILGQQREIEKLKSKLAISKSIARHYRKDARVLLKEQEAVEPVPDYIVRYWRCPKCNWLLISMIDDKCDIPLRRDNYCAKCGRRLKWK